MEQIKIQQEWEKEQRQQEREDLRKFQGEMMQAERETMREFGNILQGILRPQVQHMAMAPPPPPSNYAPHMSLHRAHVSTPSSAQRPAPTAQPQMQRLGSSMDFAMITPQRAQSASRPRRIDLENDEDSSSSFGSSLSDASAALNYRSL